VTVSVVILLGTPVNFIVVDTCKVSVKGEGLGLVQCGHVAMFMITAPDAQLKDIAVAIKGELFLNTVKHQWNS
jgi:hypothetical protein